MQARNRVAITTETTLCYSMNLRCGACCLSFEKLWALSQVGRQQGLVTIITSIHLILLHASAVHWQEPREISESVDFSVRPSCARVPALTEFLSNDVVFLVRVSNDDAANCRIRESLARGHPQGKAEGCAHVSAVVGTDGHVPHATAMIQRGVLPASRKSQCVARIEDS